MSILYRISCPVYKNVVVCLQKSKTLSPLEGLARYSTVIKNDVNPAKNLDTECIYRGPDNMMVRGVKIFSLVTTATSLIAQPFLIKGFMNTQLSGMKVVYTLGIATCSVVIMSPLLLHILSRRYVFEMYYNRVNDTYTTATLSLLNKKTYTTFKQDDIRVPSVLGPFTSFLVGKRPFLVDPHSFIDIQIYKKMTGLDKVPKISLEELDAIMSKEEAKSAKDKERD